MKWSKMYRILKNIMNHRQKLLDLKTIKLMNSNLEK